MSIKTRLMLSYFAMTFIPVFLFAMIAASLSSVLFKDTAGTGEDLGVPPFWAMSEQRNELMAGILFMAKEDPDRFDDRSFLQRTDRQLQRLRSGVVVAKGGRVVFASPGMSGFALAQLREMPANPAPSRWNHWAAGRYSVKKAALTFRDGNAGELYLLSDSNAFAEGARKFFPLLVLSLLLVIALTNGIMTYLVSRSLVKPLHALKLAAERIKEGDLSRRVEINRKDEIGKLGAAFEEMRVRLGESIRLQLQYEENRKELISNISHDLKTPITGIKACVEGIQDGIAATEAKREKYMGMIEKKANEMDRLIDELFLFSKLDLNRLPFQLEPLDLSAYLRDCAEELRADPRLEDVAVDFAQIGEGAVRVVADREKLHRVVMNIVENSLKYMDKPKPEIRLELRDGPREATVVVADNGAGIDQAALPHIFDRFYRAEPSRSAATGGSGLGLAIVKQMIEGQGGTVRADSRLGEGTAIAFTLPKWNRGGEEA